ncbi:MAG: hypothetical protein R3304_06940 [Longimicrobiales bacterium]|nr:hypothetical protein [Longimicrobiales bacterium]
MILTRAWVTATLVVLCAAPAVLGQGVVVDQGRFAIRVDGRAVGSEDFVIRRATLGLNAAFFANGVVSVTRPGDTSETRPLLRALPPDGQVESYQVEVTGDGEMDLRLALSGRRYVATIRSDIGDEDREFQARPDTRVLDRGVAHHHYFVRDLRVDRAVHVLEPRTRSQYDLTATRRTDEELRVGPNVVLARRVDFISEEGADRTVWYDRQGRVLRVEIPSISYVAERTDLVG